MSLHHRFLSVVFTLGTLMLPVTIASDLHAGTTGIQAHPAVTGLEAVDFAADINRHLGRSVDVAYRYVGAPNALAVAMSHTEALKVSNMLGVVAVFGDALREIATDVGPLLIGANYLAADPAPGGDSKNLNKSSIVSYNCPGLCTWTRTVRSTLIESADYTASFSGPAGMTATVTPSSFTIPAGGTQILTIEVDVSALPVGHLVFGSIILSTTAEWPANVSTGRGTASYSGNTTGAPPWQRPFTVGGGSSGTCDLSGTVSAVPYLVQHFGLDTTGLYDIVSTQDYDGYLHLYANTFDPLDQCVDLIALNDDGGPGSEIIGFNLNAGTTYHLVTSGFSNSSAGNFTHAITGPGEITLIGLEGNPVADTNLPVVVLPVLGQSVITLEPDELNLTQVPDTQSMQVLTIGNNGDAVLNWKFLDVPIATTVTVWDQPVNGISGVVSDFFIGSNAGAYSASDFVISEPTDLAMIYAAGFDTSNALSSQPGINWAIYADAGGVPAGHPEDGTNLGSALWAYTAAVDGPGVDITDNNIALDLNEAGESVSLAAGTYWLTVYPSYNVTGAGGARWNWFQSAQLGAQAQLVSPVIFGQADWTSLGDLGLTFVDTAFRIDASAEIACVHPDDLSWLSVSPALGTIGPAGATDLNVTFDTTGLALGQYNALLCIDSNDPENPLIVLPVGLNVAGDELFRDRFE